MQLSRYGTIASSVEQDAAVVAEAVTVRLWRHTDGGWYDASGAAADAATAADLSRTKSGGTEWRHRGARTGYFWLAELDAAAEVRFSSAPKQRTLSRFRDVLQTAVANATNAWSARHEHATGLINKSTFEALVAREVDEQQRSVDAESQAVQVTRTTSVVTMDIDHFKQANDTHGHAYGDVVLQCFANRLRRSVADLEVEHAGRASFHFGRTGGEEFSILISGALAAPDVAAIAERLRVIVADAPLPSDDEWRDIATHASEGRQLPHVAERRTTVSVGVATLADVGRADPAQLAVLLREQADLALYRAKAGGRNAVRHFSDIASRYGTVLEQHEDTGIVAIDIGRNVGVRVGHEFRVYHPDFVGGKYFMRADGRTQRRLGQYPRQSYGRIVVFEVQQDISFARVSGQPNPTPFRPGSQLELVPLGAIEHLLNPDSSVAAPVDATLMVAERVSPTLKGIIDAELVPAVLVFDLANAGKLADEWGVAFVNQVLFELVEALRKAFATRRGLSQVGPTRFAVLLASQPPGVWHKAAETVASEVRKRSGERAEIRIGAYSPDSEVPAPPGDASKLRPQAALEYALYAALAPGRDAGVPVHFNSGVATALVSAARSAGRAREALADYRAMRELGIDSAYLENQAALAAYTLEDMTDVALEYARRATSLAPDNLILRANLGYFLFFANRHSEAYEAFSAIPDVSRLPDVYLYPIAMAHYEVHRTAPAVVEREAVLSHVDRALASPTVAAVTRARADLTEALVALRAAET